MMLTASYRVTWRRECAGSIIFRAVMGIANLAILAMKKLADLAISLTASLSCIVIANLAIPLHTKKNRIPGSGPFILLIRPSLSEFILSMAQRSVTMWLSGLSPCGSAVHRHVAQRSVAMWLSGPSACGSAVTAIPAISGQAFPMATPRGRTFSQST